MCIYAWQQFKIFRKEWTSSAEELALFGLVPSAAEAFVKFLSSSPPQVLVNMIERPRN
jgi:hypothetical protein